MGQLTQKSKAKSMEDSIQWLRNHDPELDYVDVGTLQAFTDMTGVPTPNIITSQKKKRRKAMGVVKWLEDQDEPEDEVIEVLKEVIPARKIADGLKKKRKKHGRRRMSPTENRRREDNAEIAIEWLRKNEPIMADISSDDIKVLASMTGVVMPLKRTNRTRKKAMMNAIEWFRNNDQSFDDVDDKTVEVFTKMTGTAKPPKLTSKLKKKAMEDSIEWLRKNEPELDEIADDTVQAFTNMTGVVVPDKLDKRAKKRKTRDAIAWIRNNNVNLEEVPDTCLHVLEEIVPPSAVSPRVPPSDV